MKPWRERLKIFRESFQPEDDKDWTDTRKLKGELAQFRQKNSSDGLTPELFDNIVAWKLGRQRGRTEKHRSKITPLLVYEITATAFRLQHEDEYYLARVRLSVLRALPGVGIGIASAILALTFPDQYAVIDDRVWDVIYREVKEQFEWSDYEKYLREVCAGAEQLGCDPQEVDFLAWKMYEEEQQATQLA